MEGKEAVNWCLQHYLIKRGDPLLQRIEAVGSGGSSELRRQRLQLHHQASIQGLQQGRLRLLLLQLEALHQLLQLRDITEFSVITPTAAQPLCLEIYTSFGFISCNLKCLV